MEEQKNEDITSEIVESDEVVGTTEILYFSSPWCGPCKTMTPGIEELSSSYKVTKYDMSVQTDLEEAVNHNVQSTPTIIVRRHVPQEQDVQGFIDQTFSGGMPFSIITNYLENGVLPK